MAEHDPASTVEYKQHLQLLERLTRWKQKVSAIPIPEEALRLEKAELAAKKRAAREEMRRWVLEDSEALARFNEAADRESHYAARLGALEDRCGCQAWERIKTYRQEHAELQRRCGVPVHLTLEEYLRLPSPSPPPRSTPYSSARGRTPPPSDTADAPISPLPSGSFPPAASGDDRGRGPSPEQEHHGHGVEQASHAGPSSSAIEARISAEGDGTTTDDVRSATASDRVVNNKRKATESSFIYTISLSSKRLRPNESEEGATTTATLNDNGQGDAEVQPEHEPDSDFLSESEAEPNPFPADSRVEQPRFASQRWINFDDVYQDGNGRYKHHIALHKGTFYIIRCDACEMHFGDNPLLGGGRHLDSDAHRHLSRARDVTVAVIGIEVRNCDIERQRQNNAAFKMALDNGYRVHRKGYAARNQNPQPQQQATATTASTTSTTDSAGTGNTANPRRRNPRIADEAVLSPVPGQIYIAYWNGPVPVAVIVLPRGDCFGDPSFEEAGLNGSSLVENTDLMANVPECYRTTPESKEIIGWQEGYEDGGNKVHRREYPVMYIDGFEDFQKGSVTVIWIWVGNLREYNREDYVGNGGLIDNYTHLRQFEKGRERAREAAAGQQAGDAAVDDRRSETSEPELPDYTPPPSPPQPTEAVEPSPETMASSRMDRAPSEPQDYPSHAAGDEHRNGERDSAPPDAARTGIRPTPENIVGHAATMGDGVPPHHRADQAVCGPGERAEGPSLESVHSTASTAPNHSCGAFDGLGSENASLMSHSIPYGVHAAHIASTRALGSEVALSSLPSLRHTATVDPRGPRPGGTTGHSTVEQSPVNRQAGPSTRVAPPVIPQTSTSGTPLHLSRNGDTRDSAIVIDDLEEPPTKVSYGLAKRTHNGLGPFGRSFDLKPVVSQDMTPGPQPQYSTAQPGRQGLSQGGTACMATTLRPMPAAPEAQMGVMPDPSDIDFEAYIREP